MTITLAGEEGQPDQTYIAANATVTIDGTASTLRKIAIGSDVHLKLASDGTTVLGIEAESGHGQHGADSRHRH